MTFLFRSNVMGNLITKVGMAYEESRVFHALFSIFRHKHAYLHTSARHSLIVPVNL